MKVNFILALLLLSAISIFSLELTQPVLGVVMDQGSELVYLTGYNSNIVVFDMGNRNIEKIIDIGKLINETVSFIKIHTIHNQTKNSLLEIYTATNTLYCLFNMNNFEIINFLPKEITEITSAVFSKDGSQLALGTGVNENMQIVRWNPVSGDTTSFRFQDHFEETWERTYYYSIGFLDDTILCAGSQRIRELYSWPDLELLQIVDGDTNPYEIILDNRTILVPKDGDRPVLKITLPDKIPFTEINKEDIYSYWSSTNYLETMDYSFPLNSLGLHKYWSQIFSDGKILVTTRTGDWAVMDYATGELLGHHKMEKNNSWMTKVNFKKSELLRIEEFGLYIYALFSGELLWSYVWRD